MSNTRLPNRLQSTQTQPHLSRRKLYAAMLVASQWMAAGQLWAAPEGGEVVGGEGVITQTGVDTMIHQATERMAIDWRSFDVAANERVEFIQPSSSSIALNRVLSNRGSEILGRIDSNGQVMLVNPNGVVFGKDSIINVGGMIASGMSIDPASFINGDFTLNSLEGTDGKVINYGIINAATGGSVTLVGQQVQNDGLISAKLGAVNLAAGKEAVLTFDQSGLVGIKVTEAVLQNELGVDAAVINSGEINAEGGRVLLSASVSEDIFSNAVNNAGMNKASSVVLHDDGSFTLGAGADVINTGAIDTSVATGAAGQVVVVGNNITSSGTIAANTGAGSAGAIELHSTDTTLVTETGSVSAQAATQGKGGDIKVLGNKVGLFDAAQVNASGAYGGGQVLIGGDKTGQNQQIRNADFIYLGKNTNVKTDALIDGDGGKLITFASDTARIYGNLYSRGGSEGGNGGFIETSGLKGFEILTTPDMGASAGDGGTWLIDPFNITINGDKKGDDDFPPADTTNRQFTSTKNSNLSIESLNDALANGNVKVQTGNGDSGDASDGWIKLTRAVSYSGGDERTLTFDAHNGIEINEDITSSGGRLNLVLNANSDSDSDSVGDFKLANGRKIETNGGNVTITGVNFNAHSNRDDFGTINTYGQYGGGDINIEVTRDVNLGATRFDYAFGSANGSTAALVRVGSLTIKAGRDVTLNEIKGTINKSENNSNTDVDAYYALNFNNTGKRQGDGDPGYTSGNLDDTLLLIEAGRNIAITGKIIDSWGDARDALNVTLTAVAGNITIEKDIYTAGGNFTATAKNFSATNNALINTDKANDNNNYGQDPHTKVSVDGDWSNGGNITINATNVANATSTVSLGSLITDASAPKGGNRQGNLIIQSVNGNNINVTQTGLLNVAGTSTFNTGTGGNITLLNAGNIFTGDLLFTSAGTVKLTDKTAVNLGVSNINGDFELTSGGDITQSGALSVTSATTLTAVDASVPAVSKNITLNNAGNNFGGLVTVTKAATLSLTGSNNLSIDSFTATGDVDLTSGSTSAIILKRTLSDVDSSAKNIRFNSNVELASATTLNAGVGKIDFTKNINSAAAKDLTLNGGDITLTGAIGNSQALGDVTINSSGAVTIGAASINSSLFTVTGLGAADSLTLSNGTNNWLITSANAGSIGKFDTNNDPLPPVITFSGIENIIGSGQDSLTGIAQANDWQITDIDSGSVKLKDADTGVINFSSFKNLKGNAGADVFTFINIDGKAGGITGTVDGGVGVNTIIGRNAATTWTLTGANAGYVNVTSGGRYVNQFTNIQNLTGGTAADIFDFSTTNIGDISGTILGDIADATAATANTIKARTNATNTWTMTGDNVGSLTQSSISSDPYSKFTNIQIFTGAGSDTMSYASATGAVTAILAADGVAGAIGITGVTNIIGNGDAESRLVGANAINIWSIAGDKFDSIKIGNQSVIDFSGFAKLTGGNLDDTFVFSDAGSITSADAGDGDDIVDLSKLTGAQTIFFTGSTVNGVSSVFRVIGNATQTLAATAGTNTWSLFDIDAASNLVSDGINDGHVSNGTDTLQFVNFSNLQGGSGIDTFNIDTNFNGVIKGGLNNDIFNIKAVAGNIDGEAGDDSFVFYNTGSITNGGLGGVGNNIVDISNLASAQTITFTGTTVKGVSDIYRVVGSATQNHTLKSTDGANTWRLFDIDNDAGSNLVSDGVNDGHITNSIGTMQFVNFKNLQGGDGVDTFDIETNFTGDISGGLDNDIFNIKAVVGKIDGEAGDDSFVFYKDGSLTKGGSGSSGNNIVDISNLVGAETITFTGTTVKGVSDIYRVVGSATQNHTLEATAGTNTWRLFDIDNDAVSSLVSDGINDGHISNSNGTLQFVNFSNLRGGSDVDTFDIETNFTGLISGGGNGDIFNIKAAAGNIDGEAGDDSFVFYTGGSITAGGSGGLGNNIFDISNLTSAQTITFTGTTVKGVSNIFRVVGSTDKNHTLEATAGTNTWRLFDIDNDAASNLVSDGVNDGHVTNSNGTMQFVNFSNLQGGDGVDTFNIETNFNGVIKGGLNNDIFNIKAVAGNIDGEAGDDSFVFYTAGSITNGGLGGVGNNIVDISNLASAQTITFTGTTVKGVSNIFRVVGSTDKNHTLEATAGTNTWRLFDIDNDAGSSLVSDGVNDGHVTNSNGTMQFVNFSNLQGGDGVDTFNIETNFNGVIKGGLNNDIFNIKAVAGNIDGEAGDDSFIFYTGGSITAGGSGSSGNNIVDISNLVGAETITFTGTTVKGVSDTYRVVGSATQSHTLKSTDGTNTWRLFDIDNDAASNLVSDGINDGEITNSIGTLQFVNFGNLQGGDGVDTFNIETNFTGVIKGGLNNDIFNIKAVAGNIDGEAGDDSFVFYNTGSITAGGSGGLGNNIFDISNLTSAQTITFTGTTVKGVSNIFRVVGSADKNHTLEATAGTNTWRLFDIDNDAASNLVSDGVNDGHVTNSNGTMQFVNFGNLQGGDGVDTFNIETNFTGVIKGGLNNDIFNIKAVAGNLQGEAGDDSFVFFDAGNVTKGDGGADNNIADLSNLTSAQTITFSGTTVKNIDSIFRVVGNAAQNHTLAATTGTNNWRIFDVDNNTASTVVSDGVNDGRVSNGTDTLEFVNFSNLQGGDGIDTFDIETKFTGVIKGGLNSDTFNIKAVAGNIDGEAGDDSFVFYDTGSFGSGGSGSGGSGNNTVDLSKLSGAQTITFTGLTVKGVTNVFRVIGNSAQTLAATSGTNNWRIFDVDNNATSALVSDGVNDGQVSNGTDTLQFVNFRNLQGGDGVDTFDIETNFAGDISGGLDSDIFKIKAVAGNIDGEAGDDSFVFYTAGNISSGGSGASGKNIVDISNLTGAQIITFTGTTVKGVSNIYRVIGSATQNHTLAATSGANIWSLFDIDNDAASNLVSDGINDGQITNNIGTMQFVNFSNLQGGDGVDTFNIETNFTGVIKGGLNNDIFNIKAVAGNLQGEAGDDSFVFFDAGNVTKGDGGVDNNIADLSNLTSAQTISFTGTTVKNIGSIFRVIGNALQSHTLAATTGTNNWRIFDVDNNTASTAVSDGVNDGRVSNGTDTLEFVNFSNLQGGDGIDTFEIETNFAGDISGGLNNDIFNIKAVAGNLFGNSGNDRFIFNNNAGSALSIDGGVDTNTLVGRNAENTWTLIATNSGNLSTNGINYVTNFSAIHNLEGGSEADTLIGANQDNAWNITGNNIGKLQALGSTGPAIAFTSFENLIGSNQARDTFTFANGAYIKGLIDGGSSATLATTEDSVNLSALTNGIVVELGYNGSNTNNIHLVNIESITAFLGNTNANKLIGASDAAYRWNVTAPNTGVIELATSPSAETSVKFTNFGDLVGGTNNDRFNVQASVSNRIRGGDGTGVDLVDYSNRKEDFTITLGDDGVLDTGDSNNENISGIEGIIGNSRQDNAYNSIINVTAGDNIWTIGAFDAAADGRNDGTVNINGKIVTFENFNQLIGGSGKDTFEYSALGQLVGLINGGGGDNAIDASGSTLVQEFHLNGTDSGVTNLKQISKLKGSATNSTLVSTASPSGNIWNVDKDGVGILNTTFTFLNIANLKGGALADIFNLESITPFTGIIDGGSGSSVDAINLTQLASDVSVGIGATGGVNLRVINIESIQANTNKTNTLVADSQADNAWVISGNNKGTLNTTILFSGFANLAGREKTDTFSFANESSNITGWIDAGAGVDRLDLTTANRDLVVRIVSDDMLVNSGQITAKNFESIDADVAKNNTLIANNIDNIWNITSTNSGRLSDTTASVITDFKNFKNLKGGNQNDTFFFESIGNITGLVDGAGQRERDVVDVSKSANANIVIAAENAASGYSNIEKYVGNNTTSTITSDNKVNNWVVNSNNGTINSTIEFEQFVNLVGGSNRDTFSLTNAILSGYIDGAGGNDTFTLTGSTVAGEVRGGLGDDVFELNVVSGFTGSANLLGGQGSNRILVAGGDAGYKATHQQGVIQYANEANATYTANYSDIADMVDNVLADSLAIGGTSAADVFRLQTNKYQLNSGITINYLQKQNLIINGSSADQVILDGNVTIPKLMTVNNASLTAENAGKLVGQGLELVATQNVGSASNRVQLAVDDLYLKSTNGNIFINEQDSLSIKEFATSNTEIFDLALGGDLLSTAGITYTGQFNINSSLGAIALSNANSFTGNLNLKAAGNVTLRNLTSVNFTEVAAQNLTVETDGAVTGAGPMIVNGLTSISANSTVSLLHADNDFNSLKILKAGNVSLKDKNNLTLTGISADGLVTVNTNGAINISASCFDNCSDSFGVRVAGLDLNAGAGSITAGKNITASDSVVLQANGITINDTVTAKRIAFKAGSGGVLLNESGNLNGRAGDLIDLAGTKVDLRSNIVGGANVNITATDDIQMAAGAVTESASGNVSYTGKNIGISTVKASSGAVNLSAAGTITVNNNGSILGGTDINLSATDDIQMAAGSVTESVSGNVTYKGKNIGLATIKAVNGAVNTTASGAITDNNEAEINIYAQRWNADALFGIGTGRHGDATQNAMETNISVLSANNAGKLLGDTTINIVNTGTLIIEQLRNNGDISIANLTGDFILDRSEKNLLDLDKAEAGRVEGGVNSKITNASGVDAANGEKFNPDINDARFQGGVINANTGKIGGRLSLTVPNGMVRALGKAERLNPDIIADQATFNFPLGTRFSFGERNRKIVMHIPELYNQTARTSSVIWYKGRPKTVVDTSTPLQNLVSNEQLIQIEALSEIDPAIFTSVSNYIHDEVAILMPADQRFDDDEYAE